MDAIDLGQLAELLDAARAARDALKQLLGSIDAALHRRTKSWHLHSASDLTEFVTNAADHLRAAADALERDAPILQGLFSGSPDLPAPTPLGPWPSQVSRSHEAWERAFARACNFCGAGAGQACRRQRDGTAADLMHRQRWDVPFSHHVGGYPHPPAPPPTQ